MHIIDSVVHNRCCYVFTGETLCPGRFHVQIEAGFTTILTDVFL